MSDAPQRRWLIIAIGAACVLAAAIGLVIVVRGGGATASATAPKTADPTTITPPTDTPSSPSGPVARTPVGLGTPKPLRDDVPDQPDVTSADGATHDHRANPAAYDRAVETPVPPADHKGVFVAQEFAGDVGRLVTPIARECAAQIPASARGTKPVIQVQMIVTIKSGQMTIDDVNTDFRDVTGDQAAVKDCVKAKARTISVDAAGQPDVDHYSITMPMRVAS